MSRNAVKVWGLVVVAAAGACVLGVWVAPRPVRSAAAVTKPGYQGHRVLAWAIDRATHEVKGFDDKVIRPGERVTLLPDSGDAVAAEVGRVQKVQMTDFRREWEEDNVPFTISRGTGSSEGMKDLVSPFLDVEYGTKSSVDCVLFAAPVGAVGPVGAALGGDDLGRTAALEDLLLAVTGGATPSAYVRPGELLHVYTILGRSDRIGRWRQRLDGGLPVEKNLAAAVLMTLGDPQGTAAFCAACLAAKGNARVGLIELLVTMPPSDRALETIVALIVGPDEYLLKGPPGVGYADTERRYNLIRALKEKYPRDKILRHADALRAWASSAFGKRHGGDQILAVLDGR